MRSKRIHLRMISPVQMLLYASGVNLTIPSYDVGYVLASRYVLAASLTCDAATKPCFSLLQCGLASLQQPLQLASLRQHLPCHFLSPVKTHAPSARRLSRSILKVLPVSLLASRPQAPGCRGVQLGFLQLLFSTGPSHLSPQTGGRKG